MILGLDISTSCVGFALLNMDGSLYKAGFFRLDDKKIAGNLIKKMEKFLKEFNLSLKSEIPRVTVIGVEEYLKNFTPKKSTANTITNLAAINFCISYQIYLLTNILPTRVHFISARSKCKIKFRKGTDPDIKKEEIAKLMQTYYPDAPWKKIKSGKYQKFCYDMADALLIARYIWLTQESSKKEQK